MIHLTFDYKTDEKCTTPGQYLKYHRTFQGLTTRELAEKVGIVPATLVLYENDRHPIKHGTAVALANALGIDRNRLLDEYTAFVDYPYSSLLKKVRQELSLTQMQMAEVIGIGQTTYSGWEREARVPRRKEYDSPSADAHDGNGKTLVECPVTRKFSSQNRNWFRFWSFPGKSLRKNAVQGIITV